MNENDFIKNIDNSSGQFEKKNLIKFKNVLFHGAYSFTPIF